MTGDPVWPAHVYLVSTYSPIASRPLDVTGGVELVRALAPLQELQKAPTRTSPPLSHGLPPSVTLK